MSFYGLTPMDLVVALAVITSAVTDVREGRIFNSVTLPLWGIGVIYWLVRGLLGGPEPFWTGLLGLAVMFPLHFLFFAIGLDKGGDAKLMIGVGACYGWWLGLEASVYAILLMGPVALAYMIFKGKIGSLWHHIRYLTIDQVKSFMGLPIPDKPEPVYIIKGIVLLIAVFVARFSTVAEGLLGETLRAWAYVP